MPIKFNAMQCHNSEHASLSELRKQILAAAKEAEKAGRHDTLTVTLPQGKITATEPLSLSVKKNPELASVDITLRAEVPGASEINSLVRLDGKEFTPVKNTDYFLYQFKKKRNAGYPLFNDFFLNFNRIHKSRSAVWHNLDALTNDEREGKTKREGFWAPIDIAKKVAAHDIGATELVMYIEWVFSVFHVEKIDLTRTRTENGVTYALVVLKEGEMDDFCQNFARNRALTIANREMFFRNSPALLEENTFAYDYFKGRLYVNAAMPEYMRCHALEYAALETLIELDGIENFTVEGVAFSGTTCKYGCENVYRCGQANIVGKCPDKRTKTAAIFARDVKRLTVDGCSFKNLGTNGIQIVDRSVRATVKNSRFLDVSMSAVTIGNPTWNWQEEKNRTFGAHIENNYMNHIAYEYPAAPAIYIGQVDGLKILRNTVIDCAYSAISVGWNWNPVKWELGEQVNIRDAEIAYNYFHNFMQLLKDGGAIYVLGSNCNHFTCARRFNRMHHNFAMIDAHLMRPGRYGYYCDGSSSNWEVSDSVVINVMGVPIFSQPHPHALSYHNTFRNIYSTTERHQHTHVPDRDVLTENYVLVKDGADALLEQHPEAKAIRDGAGTTLIP